MVISEESVILSRKVFWTNPVFEAASFGDKFAQLALLSAHLEQPSFKNNRLDVINLIRRY